MNNSPESMGKDDIIRRLNEIVDYHLFESWNWPADEDELRSFWRIVEEMGLQERVPGEASTFRYTTLGTDCEVELASCFIGGHELFEIPTILKSNGLIDEVEEADYYGYLEEGMADDGLMEKYVEAMVRRAHSRRYGSKNKRKSEAAERVTDEAH